MGNGLFQKKIRNPPPPVKDINEKFQGGVKVVGIPGGMSKFEGKTRISKGGIWKKVENYKIDWKSKGVKLISSTGGNKA